MYSTIINIYVVVNFFVSGNFYFPFVSTASVYISIPKNKRKTKITWDKKINYLQPNYYKFYHTLLTGSEKNLASFGPVIENLYSESQNGISEDLNIKIFPGNPLKIDCQSRQN